jgi:ADP-ribose pyrophosphatase
MTEKKTSFTHNDYEIVKREILHQGIYRMVRYHLRYRLFNGGFSHVIDREVMERSSSAGILLYDPFLDQVVLIEQFRAGALGNPPNPWLLEVVAGTLEENELPDHLAKREAQEEAGCEVLDIYPICSYFTSPGGCNEFISLFCGRVDASNAGGLHGLKEEDEDIRTFTVPSDDAFKMVQTGEIRTSPAIISLQWLQLNREWLKQLWQA